METPDVSIRSSLVVGLGESFQILSGRLGKRMIAAKDSGFSDEEVLVHGPALIDAAHFDADQCIYIRSDESIYALGAVLRFGECDGV